MSVPAPIVLSTPTDLIAALPHMLGFQPEESVVAVVLQGVRDDDEGRPSRRR